MRQVTIQIAENDTEALKGAYAYAYQRTHSIPITGFGGMVVVDHQVTGHTFIASTFPSLVHHLERCARQFLGEEKGGSHLSVGVVGALNVMDSRLSTERFREEKPPKSIDDFLKEATDDQLVAMRSKISGELNLRCVGTATAREGSSTLLAVGNVTGGDGYVRITSNPRIRAFRFSHETLTAWSTQIPPHVNKSELRRLHGLPCYVDESLPLGVYVTMMDDGTEVRHEPKQAAPSSEEAYAQHLEAVMDKSQIGEFTLGDEQESWRDKPPLL